MSATLLRETSFPLLQNGKKVGEYRVPAGSKLSVLSEREDSVLASFSASTAIWIPKDWVAGGPSPAQPVRKATPETTPTPEPTFSDRLIDATRAAAEKIGSELKKIADENPKAAAGLPMKAGTEQTGPRASEQGHGEEIKGDAMEAFLVESLLVSDRSKDAINDAERTVAALKLGAQALPQATLANLNGTLMKRDGVKGHFQVMIDGEADHRSTPGFASGDLETLKTALAVSGRSAIVELSKSEWSLKDGTFAAEKKLKKGGAPETVLLSGYREETDSFLCRKSKNGQGIFGRISSADLALCGTAMALAKVTWREDDKTEAILPPDFHYDKTLIIPGQFAFLAVPFIKQLPRGICTAAATVNVLSYIDPDLNMDQEEIFQLFNDQRSGATSSQMLGGLENLGFEYEFIPSGSLKAKDLVAKIQASLDAGRPVIITQPRHALTMIGYDNSEKALIAWDQRGRVPGHPDFLPKGGFLIPYAGASKQIMDVFFVRKAFEKPSREEEERILAMLPEVADIQRHTLVNSNEGREKDSGFARHALPQTIKSLARRNRTLLIFNGKTGIIQVTPVEEEGGYSCIYLPEKQHEKRTSHTISREILDEGGTFFSAKGKEL